MQLALAISASSADHRAEPSEDPDESAQIDAAKRISLGCCSASGSSAGDFEAFVELLSLRYWVRLIPTSPSFDWCSFLLVTFALDIGGIRSNSVKFILFYLILNLFSVL